MSKKKNNKQNKAIKCRIYPTIQQQKFFIQTFGCCRKVWNLMLNDKIENYKLTKHFGTFTPAMYKEQYPFLKDTDSSALANVQIFQQDAFNKCFNKAHKSNNGFPKFKSKKYSKNSYTTSLTNDNIKIIDNKYIKLPKLKTLVKIKIHRPIPNGWIIKKCTISMNRANEFYCAILFEYDKYIKPLQPNEDNTIGLDYKSDGLYVDSNGHLPDIGTKWYRQAQDKRTKQQRKLSRQIESQIIGYKTVDNKRYPIYDKPLNECSNIQKQKLKIAKTENKVSNQRKDALHKESRKIANSYDFVCVETLDMKSLSNKGFGNGKATMDNAYGMFLNMLDYKLSDKGGALIKIDKWYPSSQICNCCGFQNKALKDLSIRDWVCPNCNSHNDRDINAALNIKKCGLEMVGTG